MVDRISTESTAGPICIAPGSRTAAAEAVRTQYLGWERLAGLPPVLCWCLVWFLPVVRSLLQQPLPPNCCKTLHLGTQEQRCYLVYSG